MAFVNENCEGVFGMEPFMFLQHEYDGDERAMPIGERMTRLEAHITVVALYLGPYQVCTSFILVVLVHQLYRLSFRSLPTRIRVNVRGAFT